MTPIGGAGVPTAPVTSAAAPSGAAGTTSPVATSTPTLPPETVTSLAASVVALSRGGRQSAELRLDPASLGAVSVHLAMMPGNAVSVTFSAAVPQTAQLLHNTLGDLSQAMASAGLGLAQAQVGGGPAGGFGGGSQSNTGGGQQAFRASPPAAPNNEAATTPLSASGARAIA